MSVVRFAIEDGEFEDGRTRARLSGGPGESLARRLVVRGPPSGRKADPPRATTFFTAVAGELPGELAPKLALATCLESQAATDGGDSAPAAVSRLLNEAARYYTVVAETEPGYASAGFGLARVFLALGDRDGAVAALQRIPKSSSAYVDRTDHPVPGPLCRGRT